MGSSWGQEMRRKCWVEEWTSRRSGQVRQRLCGRRGTALFSVCGPRSCSVRGPAPFLGSTRNRRTRCAGAPPLAPLYSSSIFHGTTRSPIAVRLDGLRKDCCGFCQEVERVGSDPICAGSLCLKVLHCNQFQSLTLTTLYRHTVGFCRID